MSKTNVPEITTLRDFPISNIIPDQYSQPNNRYVSRIALRNIFDGEGDMLSIEVYDRYRTCISDTSFNSTSLLFDLVRVKTANRLTEQCRDRTIYETKLLKQLMKTAAADLPPSENIIGGFLINQLSGLTLVVCDCYGNIHTEVCQMIEPIFEFGPGGNMYTKGSSDIIVETRYTEACPTTIELLVRRKDGDKWAPVPLDKLITDIPF